MHLKIPEKFSIPEKFWEAHQHGLFLLMTLGLVFSLVLGVGTFFKKPATTPNAPGLAFDGGLSGTPPGSFVLKPEDEPGPVDRQIPTLSRPALWQGGDQSDQSRMARLDRQYFYAATGAKTPMPDRFEVDLHRFSKRPAAHLHVRQVDYNELGYGGGLKIAFEVVEPF